MYNYPYLNRLQSATINIYSISSLNKAFTQKSILSVSDNHLIVNQKMSNKKQAARDGSPEVKGRRRRLFRFHRGGAFPLGREGVAVGEGKIGRYAEGVGAGPGDRQKTFG